jgi:ankyrin repeat protein
MSAVEAVDDERGAHLFLKTEASKHHFAMRMQRLETQQPTPTITTPTPAPAGIQRYVPSNSFTPANFSDHYGRGAPKVFQHTFARSPELTPSSLEAVRSPTDGGTNIWDASFQGDEQRARVLLTRDNSLVNVQDERGNTPLVFACISDKVQTAYLLVDKPPLHSVPFHSAFHSSAPSIHSAPFCFRNTPLVFACISDKVQTAYILVWTNLLSILSLSISLAYSPTFLILLPSHLLPTTRCRRPTCW